MRVLAMVRVAAIVGLAVAIMSGSLRADDSAEPRQVELFSAMESGDIDVRFIPTDSRQANVLIQNNTEQPLEIALPDTFAGVPVLAQFAGGGGNGQGQGGGFNPGGGNNNFFHVGPQRERRIRVQTVCLEHGKDEPNPRMEYELKPLNEFNDDVVVAEICKMLARGEIDQVSAQAAAWNVTDDLSWEELAAKVRMRHLNGSVDLFFNRNQISLAVAAVREAATRAEHAPAKEAEASDR